MVKKFGLVLAVCLSSFAGGVFAQSIGGGIGAASAAIGFIWQSIIGSAPASKGNWNAWATAFTGDLSHVWFPISQKIDGAATLGQPSSGYSYTEEAYPIAGYLFNNSGWNNSTSGNNGRTAAAFARVHVTNTGQGDAVAYNATCTVSGALGGATSYLANPACVLFNGDTFAGAAGVYLNPFEVHLNDSGFDSAGAGVVANLIRSVNTGALGALWRGIVIQSQGSAAIDAWGVGTGLMVNGLDFTGATLTNAPLIAPLVTPASSGANCKVGGIYWDTGFIYICTATNTWKRATLAAF